MKPGTRAAQIESRFEALQAAASKRGCQISRYTSTHCRIFCGDASVDYWLSKRTAWVTGTYGPKKKGARGIDPEAVVELAVALGEDKNRELDQEYRQIVGNKTDEAIEAQLQQIREWKP